MAAKKKAAGKTPTARRRSKTASSPVAPKVEKDDRLVDSHGAVADEPRSQAADSDLWNAAAEALRQVYKSSKVAEWVEKATTLPLSIPAGFFRPWVVEHLQRLKIDATQVEDYFHAECDVLKRIYRLSRVNEPEWDKIFTLLLQLAFDARHPISDDFYAFDQEQRSDGRWTISGPVTLDHDRTHEGSERTSVTVAHPVYASLWTALTNAFDDPAAFRVSKSRIQKEIRKWLVRSSAIDAERPSPRSTNAPRDDTAGSETPNDRDDDQVAETGDAFLGLTIVGTRVHRAGSDFGVNLAKAKIRRHIFERAFAAGVEGATEAEMQDGYPGKWNASGEAKSDFNRKFRVIKIRLASGEWRLESIDRPT